VKYVHSTFIVLKILKNFYILTEFQFTLSLSVIPIGEIDVSHSVLGCKRYTKENYSRIFYNSNLAL
jgi:hypothetical protein